MRVNSVPSALTALAGSELTFRLKALHRNGRFLPRIKPSGSGRRSIERQSMRWQTCSIISRASTTRPGGARLGYLSPINFVIEARVT